MAADGSKMRPRVVAMLLIIVGAFLSAVAAGLFASTAMLHEINVRSSRETILDPRPNPAFGVQNPPQEYLVAPEPYYRSAATEDPNCTITGPGDQKFGRPTRPRRTSDGKAPQAR